MIEKKFSTNNMFQEFKDILLFMQFFSFMLMKNEWLDRWRDKT